jgi:hypothetical protein
VERGHGVDVVYVDDGNLEKSIPLEEMETRLQMVSCRHGKCGDVLKFGNVIHEYSDDIQMIFR